MNPKYPTSLAFSSLLWGYIMEMKERVKRGEISAELHDKNLVAIVESVQEYQKEIQKFPAGNKRAIQIARAAEKLILESRAEMPDVWKRVTCTKGCNHCCHIRVDITTDEADLLAMLIEQNQVTIDVERLKDQASWQQDDWPNKSKQERACVFLKDGLCSVYKHRPLNCRKYYVVSDPKDCDNFNANGPVLNVMANELEILSTAAMDIDRKSMGESLPKTLLKALIRRKLG